MRVRNFCQGISVLEVMIAFAATTVFVAVSAPLSHDLGVRLRVIESMDVIAEAQRSLQQRCKIDRQAVVVNNQDAGFDFVPAADGFVDRIALTANCAESEMTIRLWTRNTGAELDPVVELSHLQADGDGWDCILLNGEHRHVPKICWPGK